MPSFKLIFAAATGQFEAALKEKYRPIAGAATAAIRDAGELVKAEGRANILAAGFSTGWANALRANTYPRKGKASIDAGAFIYHKTLYADVFETGAAIRGKPLLWLPLPSAPQRIGRKRMSPALYRQRVGDLSYIKPRQGNPLLVASVRLSKANAARAKAGGGRPKVTLAALRRGATGAGVLAAVPVFVGVDVVNIKRKLQIGRIAAGARDRLPQLYFKHFRGD